MRTAVIGAGIIGVTTAYELAAAGHEVTVYDRRASVASETSFANAGIVAPGYVTPWAGPGMPWKVLRGLLGRHAPVRLQGLGAWGQLPWMWRWWRACRPAVYTRNRAAMLGLARLSQARMRVLSHALQLDFEQRQGVTVLLRGDRELAQARPGLKLLAELGVGFELLDAERTRQLEPALHTDTALRAAIHLPQDGLGNCRQFAQLLKLEAQRLGAHFRFDETVLRVVPGTRPGVVGTASEQSFDAVVLCTGVDSNPLLKGCGLQLPLAPVFGYSLTAPVRHADGHPDPGPRAALMDERFKVAISRLGQRVRVAGSAELGGRLDQQSLPALRTLYKVLDDWFPGAADKPKAQHWKGARPMLPDGPPVLGPSGAPGVWLNLGHGSSGWALACGSAQVLASQVGGQATPLELGAEDLARLGMGRLSR
ncbi:MAG: D-amino acid dehydrogenase [Rubrivivax sp.]